MFIKHMSKVVIIMKLIIDIINHLDSIKYIFSADTMIHMFISSNPTGC
jgi:hypothetical protein